MLISSDYKESNLEAEKCSINKSMSMDKRRLEITCKELKYKKKILLMLITL